MSIGNGPAQTLEERVAELEKKEDRDYDNINELRRQIFVNDEEIKVLETAIDERGDNFKIYNIYSDMNERIEKLEKEVKTLKPFKANDIELLHKTRKEISELKGRLKSKTGFKVFLEEVEDHDNTKEVLRELIVFLREKKQLKFPYQEKIDTFMALEKKLASGETSVPKSEEDILHDGYGRKKGNPKTPFQNSKPEAGPRALVFPSEIDFISHKAMVRFDKKYKIVEKEELRFLIIASNLYYRADGFGVNYNKAKGIEKKYQEVK